jgi:CubicO group peptidase (beta-lactamase class C family)
MLGGLVLLAACSMGSRHASAQSERRLAWVDSIVGGHVKGPTPGAAIVVRRDGVVVHQAGYGLTAPDTGSALTPATPFYLASVSKLFTAATVLQLVEAGKLALGDSAGRYLAGLPSGARRVTIRQLLTHTSGIPDYYGALDFAKLRMLDNAAALDTIRRHGEPSFPPGDHHAYSNSNYILLAEIVRAVTGRSLPEVATDGSLRRVGLGSTGYLDGPDEPVPGRARGWSADSTGKFRLLDYRGLDLGDRVVPFSLRTVGAGGMVGSAADVDRWAQAFFSGALVNDSLVRVATRAHVSVTPGSSTIATLEGYGFGWYVSRRRDTAVVWHDGDFAGSRTILLHVPTRGITITLLANRADFPQREIASAILDGLLAGR